MALRTRTDVANCAACDGPLLFVERRDRRGQEWAEVSRSCLRRCGNGVHQDAPGEGREVLADVS